MTRVPVPDDYERGYVTVAGRKDYHYGEADVSVETVDRARNATVVEDDDGRYVGVSEAIADAVAEYLGVSVDTDTCEVVKGDGEVCGRERPCRFHDDEDS